MNNEFFMLLLPYKNEGMYFGVLELVPMELDNVLLLAVKEPEELRSYFPEPVRGLALELAT